MLISRINTIITTNPIASRLTAGKVRSYASIPNGGLNQLTNDIFVKSSDISFTSNTSEGHIFREFDKLHDPYSGILMLTQDQFNEATEGINSATTPKEMLDAVSPYTDYMHPVQKEIYYFLKKFNKKYPEAKLKDGILVQFPKAILRLREKERDILLSINDYATYLTDKALKKQLKNRINIGIGRTHIDPQIILPKSISPEFMEQIMSNPNDTYNKLLENNSLDMVSEKIRKEKLLSPFRRQHLIKGLDKLAERAKGDDKIIFEEIKVIYDRLPQSRKDKDAFIVKYAQPGRDDKEIAMRLLLPSVMTIEHIKPDDNGGLNHIKNFMPVSELWNCDRSNTPLDKYVKIYPAIPSYCQLFVDDIIDLINQDKLKGYEWYPFILRDTLLKESNGLIDIKITGLNEPKNLSTLLATYEQERKERLSQN